MGDKTTFEIESGLGMKGVYVFHNLGPEVRDDLSHIKQAKKNVPDIYTIEEFVDFLKVKGFGNRTYHTGYGWKKVPSMRPKVEEVSQGNPDLAVTHKIFGKKIQEHLNIKCLETGEERSFIFTYYTSREMGIKRGSRRLI